MQKPTTGTIPGGEAQSLRAREGRSTLPRLPPPTTDPEMTRRKARRSHGLPGRHCDISSPKGRKIIMSEMSNREHVCPGVTHVGHTQGRERCSKWCWKPASWMHCFGYQNGSEQPALKGNGFHTRIFPFKEKKHLINRQGNRMWGSNGEKEFIKQETATRFSFCT